LNGSIFSAYHLFHDEEIDMLNTINRQTLKQLREARGLSQAQLAERCNCNGEAQRVPEGTWTIPIASARSVIEAIPPAQRRLSLDAFRRQALSRLSEELDRARKRLRDYGFDPDRCS
jgi:transcriptional regulator with XRE-family HTH domain